MSKPKPKPMPISRVLRAAVPLALATALLTACGPDEVTAKPAAPSSAGRASGPSGPKGSFSNPLAWKTKATAIDVQDPTKDNVELAITPVSVTKGDPAAVDKLGIGLLTGKMPYYVTTHYTELNGSTDVGGYNLKLFLDTASDHTYGNDPTWGAPFAPCQEPSDAALHLDPGISVTTCEIYLLPEAAKPAFLSFKGDRSATTADVVHLDPGSSVTTCEIYLLPEAAKPAFLSFKGDRSATTADVVWKLG
jgi:hypothetical protein